MGNIVGFHHAAIVVPDLGRAVRFYSALAGYEKIRESRWDRVSVFNQIIGITGSSAKFCMLEGLGGYLELFEYEQPQSTADPASLNANDYGIRHLCFQVEDVEEALAQVIDLGGSKMNEPVTNELGITCVYCRDPFGNLLELIMPAGGFPSINQPSE
jgi:catechol 2,3-dioxygenase-like lactoylglutathione lyase family enzyme